MLSVPRVRVARVACSEGGCGFSGTPAAMRRHMAWRHHVVAPADWHYCGYVTRSGGTCGERFKQASDRDRHRTNVHDAGDNECEECHERHATHRPIPLSDGVCIRYLCKECIRREAGKKTRTERIVGNRLDAEAWVRQYLVVTNQEIKMNSAGRGKRDRNGKKRYRPDKLYMYLYTENGADGRVLVDAEGYVITYLGVVHVEIDENEHKDRCSEEERIRIHDFCEHIKARSYVVIRWNPDAYTPLDGLSHVPYDVRVERLVALIHHVIATRADRAIVVHYMYYSHNSVHIASNTHDCLHF
jgi:hypothetical protein